MFKKFTVKDIVFLAILSAVLLLLSAMIMPLVMFTNIYALRQLLSAPIFALFCSVAITKVPKVGSLSIIGVITAGVLLFLSPVMFFNQLFAAVLTEALLLLFFHGYRSKQAIVFASAAYVPLTLPITLMVNALMNGQSFVDQVGNVPLTLVITIGTLVLALAGALLGQKMAGELKKAGKL